MHRLYEKCSFNENIKTGKGNIIARSSKFSHAGKLERFTAKTGGSVNQ